MILKRPRAIEAIIELADYIGERSPAAAERFLTAVEVTFKQLEEMPEMGHLHGGDDPRLQNVRAWSVKGFRNYLVFYCQLSGGIEILTVIHGARDIPNVLPGEL